MRLRTLLTVVISVILLAAVGMFGILVNQSALEAADVAALSDAQSLTVHDATLVRQWQTAAAGELDDFLDGHTLDLDKDDTNDRKDLGTLVDESGTFRYAALITDPSGAVLTASRTSGLPAATDTGWTPLRTLLAEGKPGFSGIMRVNGTFLQAVAVPVKVDDTPEGALVGVSEIAGTALQKHLESLKDATHTAMVLDAGGTIGITDNPALMGSRADAAIRAGVSTAGSFKFVEYTTAGGTRMIAAMAGLPGGGAYVRTQTLTSFDGAVRDKSRLVTITLIAMLVIAILAVTALGYRTLPARRHGRHRGTLKASSLS